MTSTDYRSEGSCSSSRTIGSTRSVVERHWWRKERSSSWPLWLDGCRHGSPTRRLLSTRLVDCPSRHLPHPLTNLNSFFQHWFVFLLFNYDSSAFPNWQTPADDGTRVVTIQQQQHNNKSRGWKPLLPRLHFVCWGFTVRRVELSGEQVGITNGELI